MTGSVPSGQKPSSMAERPQRAAAHQLCWQSGTHFTCAPPIGARGGPLGRPVAGLDERRFRGRACTRRRAQRALLLPPMAGDNTYPLDEAFTPQLKTPTVLANP